MLLITSTRSQFCLVSLFILFLFFKCTFPRFSAMVVAFSSDCILLVLCYNGTCFASVCLPLSLEALRGVRWCRHWSPDAWPWPWLSPAGGHPWPSGRHDGAWQDWTGSLQVCSPPLACAFAGCHLWVLKVGALHPRVQWMMRFHVGFRYMTCSDRTSSLITCPRLPGCNVVIGVSWVVHGCAMAKHFILNGSCSKVATQMFIWE